MSVGAAWCSKSPTVCTYTCDRDFPLTKSRAGKISFAPVIPAARRNMQRSMRGAPPCMARRDSYASPAARRARRECNVLWPVIITLYLDWGHC